MFDEDEEELELLRQYEGKEFNESEDNAHSSDELDSDLEDKIMSMVQYESGLTKKKLPTAPSAPEPTTIETAPEEPEVVHAPVDLDKSTKSDFSFSNELQLNNSDLEEEKNAPVTVKDSESESDNDNEKETMQVDIAPPQVTNYIDLNDQQPVYMDDEDTSEEEAELNEKLQELIEEQIYKRQKLTRKGFGEQTVRVCFSCHQPGHERKDCTLCFDCGGPKHAESRCVGAKYCNLCKQRGHMRFDCDNYRVHGNCRLCDMEYHDWTCCPSLLHVYRNEDPPVVTPIAYCYYCAEQGHYGDECSYRAQYLAEWPSAFSILSLGMGSRFNPQKTLQHAISTYSSRRNNNNHQRWSDSSRDSSPRRGYNDKKRSRYSDDSDSRRSNKKSKSNYNDKSYKYKYTSSSLEQVFGKNTQQRSGNINWKALNNNTLPQPNRSGTVNVPKNNNNKKKSRTDYETDFPRSNVPQPSSSGIIDLTGDSRSSSPSNSNRRAPKYHGGYKRNR